MQEPQGIAHQARPVPLFVLADVSGSMTGNPTEQLNQALQDLAGDLRSDKQTADTVLLSLITFGSSVTEVCRLQPVTKVSLPRLSAEGSTAMGQAFKIVLAYLSDKQRFPQQSLVPVIVVASDGQPTDEWHQPLDEIKKHPRAKQALRMALAIGEDADRKMLGDFVTPEYPVLEANEPHKIRSFFKLVTWVTQSKSKSQGQAPAVPAPVDLLP